MDSDFSMFISCKEYDELKSLEKQFNAQHKKNQQLSESLAHYRELYQITMRKYRQQQTNFLDLSSQVLSLSAKLFQMDQIVQKLRSSLQKHQNCYEKIETLQQKIKQMHSQSDLVKKNNQQLTKINKEQAEQIFSFKKEIKNIINSSNLKVNNDKQLNINEIITERESFKSQIDELSSHILQLKRQKHQINTAWNNQIYQSAEKQAEFQVAIQTLAKQKQQLHLKVQELQSALTKSRQNIPSKPQNAKKQQYHNQYLEAALDALQNHIIQLKILLQENMGGQQKVIEQLMQSNKLEIQQKVKSLIDKISQGNYCKKHQKINRSIFRKAGRFD